MRLIPHAAAFSALLLLTVPYSRAETPRAETYLKEGRTSEGIPALAEYVESHGDDDRAWMELGTLQFVGSIEKVGQSFYRFGLRRHKVFLTGSIPLLRLPVPVNPDPEKITYEDSRQIFQQFIDDLAVAEKTFAHVDDDAVKMPLHVLDIKFDFTGKRDQLVTLTEVLQRVGASPIKPIDVITFDRMDATWIRGYCRLLSAMCEVVLAHDGRELFNSTAQLFFERAETPYEFLLQNQDDRAEGGFDPFDIMDLIAFVHLLRMPIQEPKRMEAALEHLQQCLTLSDAMWTQCLAETDDDHEWIPNPNQKGVLGIRITPEMIQSWRTAATEGNEVLKGNRLIPFWRGKTGKGVNLRRVFTEPKGLDLVMWLQGTAATPYLESGPMTRPEVWRRLTTVFQGNFITFAIWVN